MFVQVIRAKVGDEAGFTKQQEKWQREVAPGAIGYLGSTAGVTEDGRLFVAARFESPDAARRNSERPEQDEWWRETESYLSDVTFDETEDVETYRGGGSDDAGFVQIMNYRLKDRAAAKKLWEQMEAKMAEARSDVLGGMTLFTSDGQTTDIIYFRSEAEARENEKKEPSVEDKAMMEQWGQLVDGETSFTDLKEPMLHTP